MIGFKDNWKQFVSQGKECLKELKDKETRKKQVPNILTASRLLSPFILIPTALSGNLFLTGIFTGMFALTDAFDGFFARKFDASSEFGRKLDPITDKVFAISLLIPLAVSNPLILINIIGETIISLSNIKAQVSGKEPHTAYLGKVKTTSLYITIALSYLALGINFNKNIINSLVSLTALLQVASFIKYNTSSTTNNTLNNSEESIKKDVDDVSEIVEEKKKQLDPKKLSDWKEFKDELLKSKCNEEVKENIKQKKKNRTFN